MKAASIFDFKKRFSSRIVNNLALIYYSLPQLLARVEAEVTAEVALEATLKPKRSKHYTLLSSALRSALFPHCALPSSMPTRL